MTTGLSGRAYGKSRGISEATVRKYLRSGVLADAVMEDGKIDPAKADAALRASRTRGKSVPISLQAAKSRRERALARKDYDNLRKLESVAVNPAHAYLEWFPGAVEELAAIFRKLPDLALPRIEGQSATAINSALKELVNDLLVEASAQAAGRADDTRALPDEPEPNIDAMTPVELASFRAETQARRLEVERLLDLGRLRYSDLLLHEMAEATAVAKSILLAIPARTDVTLASVSADAAHKLLTAEVDLVIAALNGPTARFRERMAA